MSGNNYTHSNDGEKQNRDTVNDQSNRDIDFVNKERHNNYQLIEIYRRLPLILTLNLILWQLK